MTLRGHSNELSLSDLIQVTAHARRTSHIRITALATGEEGFLEGELFFDRGEPVFARFGDLAGASAVHAAVNEENIIYRVDGSTQAPGRNLDAGWEEVLLEAARLRDEGRVPVARASLAPAPDPSALPDAERAPTGAAEAATAAPLLPLPPPVQRRAGLILAAAIGLVALGIGALYATANWRRPPGVVGPAVVPAAEASAAAVDAAVLTGPGDAEPQLLAGTAPRSPDPSLGLRPTVVCRLLVDVNGNVQNPCVYRPRAELAAFEAVALDAVRSYRFRPARRGGKPVAAWVNWPVSFS